MSHPQWHPFATQVAPSCSTPWVPPPRPCSGRRARSPWPRACVSHVPSRAGGSRGFGRAGAALPGAGFGFHPAPAPPALASTLGRASRPKARRAPQRVRQDPAAGGPIPPLPSIFSLPGWGHHKKLSTAPRPGGFLELPPLKSDQRGMVVAGGGEGSWGESLQPPQEEPEDALVPRVSPAHPSTHSTGPGCGRPPQMVQTKRWQQTHHQGTGVP